MKNEQVTPYAEAVKLYQAKALSYLQLANFHGVDSISLLGAEYGTLHLLSLCNKEELFSDELEVLAGRFVKIEAQFDTKD